MIHMSLKQAASCLNCNVLQGDLTFTGITSDSRQVVPGMLFAAIPGQVVDGHDYIRQAMDLGAVAVLVSQRVSTGLPVLQVADVVAALGSLAGYWRNECTAKVIGITGELLTQSSMRKVEGVVKIFKEKVVNLTSLDPNSWQFVRKALEKAIGIDTVEVKVDDDRILLLGTVPTAEDLERIREIAKKSVENVTILLQVQKP